MSGYVYILTNISLIGLVKIGFTERDPFARASELQTTGVPTPFEVLAAIHVFAPMAVEYRIHHRLAENRVSDSREFFRVDASLALKVLYEESIDTACIDNSTITSLEFQGSKTVQKDSIESALELFEPGKLFNPLAGKLMMERLAKRGEARACLYLARQLIVPHSGFIQQNQRKRFERLISVAAEADLAESFYWLGVSSHRPYPTNPSPTFYFDAWLRRLNKDERIESAAKVIRKSVERRHFTLPNVLCEEGFTTIYREILETLWINFSEHFKIIDEALKESEFNRVTSEAWRRVSILEYWRYNVNADKIRLDLSAYCCYVSFIKKELSINLEEPGLSYYNEVIKKKSSSGDRYFSWSE